MVHKLGGAGSGRAAVEVQTVNFDSAVTAWRGASPDNKGRFAASVLSNLLEVGGNLEDRVGQADADTIRTQANEYIKS